jgi:hypothetical protein
LLMNGRSDRLNRRGNRNCEKVCAGQKSDSGLRLAAEEPKALAIWDRPLRGGNRVAVRLRDQTRIAMLPKRIRRSSMVSRSITREARVRLGLCQIGKQRCRRGAAHALRQSTLVAEKDVIATEGASERIR